tara:strand:+ start:212339 stop:212575 length:237 start_codon:yes stop_codon:yes gene_type:complete
MKQILGVILIGLGVIGAFYVALWWGIVQPIMTVADAIDTDTLTAGLVGREVIKFFLKEILAAVVFYVCFLLGMILLDD